MRSSRVQYLTGMQKATSNQLNMQWAALARFICKLIGVHSKNEMVEFEPDVQVWHVEMGAKEKYQLAKDLESTGT